ncbi:lactonase family protein [Nitrospira sp. Nam74]
MRNVRTIAYISNADSREISVLGLDEHGNVKIIETVAVAGNVMPLAIDPARKHLYASLRSEPYSVSTWAIDPDTGRLRPMQTVPLADNMTYLSTDRSGRYLFGASYSGHKISVNSIGAQGEVNAKPLQVISTGKHPHCIVIDSSNRFLLVPNLGDDLIMQYRFNEVGGGIAPNSPPAVATKKGAGPRHVAFHPDGRFVFCTNELDGTVAMYAFHESGTLTPHGSMSIMPAGFTAKPWTADIHLTPDGRFLYASERSSNTIAACRVNGDSGKLTLIGNYATEMQPRGFNIDPGGKYLLAVGEKSHGLTIYAIHQKTGVLRKLSHMDVGKGPNWVEIIALSQ